MRKFGAVLTAWGKALALVASLVVCTTETALAQLTVDDNAEIPLTDAERAEDVLIAAMLSPWTGDLDGMVKRGFVRMGVAQEPVAFVYDGMQQRGISVEYAREFEKHLRQSLGPGAQTLTVALVPLVRDQMFDALVFGRVEDPANRAECSGMLAKRCLSHQVRSERQNQETGRDAKKSRSG